MPDGPLTYTSTAGRQEGTTILKLDGPLTLSTMFGFQGEFRAMTPKLLIVDLSEMPYMDSAGLGLIMNAFVSAQSSGRKVVVACANERIKALMDLTKVNMVLKNYASVDEAEAAS